MNAKQLPPGADNHPNTETSADIHAATLSAAFTDEVCNAFAQLVAIVEYGLQVKPGDDEMRLRRLAIALILERLGVDGAVIDSAKMRVAASIDNPHVFQFPRRRQ